MLGLAIAIGFWGVERYRNRFEKRDLVIALAVSGGLLSVAFAPGIYDLAGAVLDIDQRYLVILLFTNLVLFGFLFYLLGLVRAVADELASLTRSLSVDQAPQTDGGLQTIFVVIPAYNEGETISSVVSSLPDSIRDYDVQPLVVSDGSVDDTATEAQYNGALVVEHPINQGQGGALKTGFDIAAQNDAGIVVTMDGDGQHSSEELPRLVDPIVADEADFVMGSRYLGVDDSRNGLVRRVGIRFFTCTINMLTKADITDCTNGYRAIRGSMLERLTLTEERFSAPELIIEARKNGLRIEEIPVTVEDRKEGETRKPKLGFALGLTRIILVTWLR